jgi:hypothetical protein
MRKGPSTKASGGGQHHHHLHGHGGDRRSGGRFRRHFGGYFGGAANAADRSDWIESVQSCLAQLVGPWVPQTGRLGPATRRAIREFQSSHQLPVTGLLDQDTAHAIKSACDSDSSNTGADSAAGAGNAGPGDSSDSELWAGPPRFGWDWRRREGFPGEGLGRPGFGRAPFDRFRRF